MRQDNLRLPSRWSDTSRALFTWNASGTTVSLSLPRALEADVRIWAEYYHTAPVKHADETGWRMEGTHGSAWVFSTPTLSLFQCRTTRSAEAPRAIFGHGPVPGTVVVDRYAGYTTAPCAIQSCSAHLLREVDSGAQACPDAADVTACASTLAPLLALAICHQLNKVRRQANRNLVDNKSPFVPF